MKKFILFFFALVASVCAFAQSEGSQITSLDQLKNDKAYSIHALTNEGYLCYNPEVSETSVSLCGVTDHSYQGSVGQAAWELPFDATNPNHAWQIVNYDSKYFVYNIGAKKFLGFVDNTYKFVDEPVDINFRTNAETETVDGHSDLTLGGTFSFRIATGNDTQYVCVCTKNTADPVKWWTYNDHGSPMVIEEVEVPADDVIGALEAEKSKVADVTYKYYVGGKLWKEVTSEQTKGETVAAPEDQAFVTIVSYDGATVVADDAVVEVQCEEALPFTTSTEEAPVYGYLRGHSNQIRYAYVNDEGLGMDTGQVEEMTEFADNYLWYFTGNLVDGFQLHNKAHGLLRATADQASVNGDANSVWQLRPGTAGSKLTENIFALWAEGVTYVNCQNALKYWNSNDAGSTFTFTVVEATDPEPETLTFKFTENEDGTITVTPSDLEATYFIHLSNASIDEAYEYANKEESYNENVSYVTYNSEVHTGVTVFDPIQWMEDWYWGYFDYTPGEWWLMVGQVTVGEPTEDGAEISATKAGEPTLFTYTVVAPIFWDEAAPTVDVTESTDDVAVKVTFNGASSVEATNYGVLAAIFDENGDAYAIAFNTLFGETVEFNKGTATLHFKKISDIREEYSNAVAESCSRIKGAVGGVDITGKVIILGKSFKVDGDKIYNDDIVADYKVDGGNITTGINGVAIDADAKIFDLQGRRIAAPVKGLNIMNGSKVVR